MTSSLLFLYWNLLMFSFWILLTFISANHKHNLQMKLVVWRLTEQVSERHRLNTDLNILYKSFLNLLWNSTKNGERNAAEKLHFVSQIDTNYQVLEQFSFSSFFENFMDVEKLWKRSCGSEAMTMMAIWHNTFEKLIIICFKR